MRSRFIRIVPALRVAGLTLLLGAAAASEGASFRLSNTSINSGTGTSAGNNFVLQAQIGELQAGPMSGAGFSLLGSLTGEPVTPAPASPCAPVPPDMLAWWRGEAGSAAEFGLWDATMHAGATIGQGLAGRGFVFDGADGRVTIPGRSLSGPFTIECWLLFQGESFQRGAYNTLLEFGNDAPWFGVLGNGTLSLYGVVQGGEVPVNTWTHVAATWDGTTARLHINGVEVASSSIAPPMGGTGLGIGRNQGETGWLGSIDEIAIYNRALNAEELRGIVQAQSTGKCQTPIPARLYASPTDVTTVMGQTVTLSARAAGSGHLRFQWYRDGVPVGGDAPDLVLRDIQPFDRGQYTVRVSNGLGSEVSAAAHLTVTYEGIANLDDSGPGSLREAILLANQRPGPDAIVMDATVSGRIVLQSGLPDILDTLTIRGPGADRLVIEAGGAGDFPAFRSIGSHHFQVEGFTFQGFRHESGAIRGRYGSLGVAGCDFEDNDSPGVAGVLSGEQTGVTVVGCVFRRNRGASGGASIRLESFETANVERCLFEGNVSAGNGALFAYASYYVDSRLIVEGCTFTNNAATAGGAASFQGAANGRGHYFLVQDSTFSGNRAGAHGGAIHNAASSLSLVNCTISGNEAGEQAGGVYAGDNFNMGAATLLNCTVVSNRCGTVSPGGNGGGILAQAATGRALLRNTIVAGNLDLGRDSSHPDVFGGCVSRGWNLIGITNGSPDFGVTNDLVGSLEAPLDAKLSALGDFGGLTWTHLPLFGSPAVDAAFINDIQLKDQRGLPRPVDEAGVPGLPGGDTCDIGAVERSTPPNSAPVIGLHPSSLSVKAGDTAVLHAGAYGSGVLRYQWRHHGVVIPGGTNSTLLVPDLHPLHAGDYTLTAINAHGIATSRSAELKVIAFLVLHTGDSGPGSLRQAILDANAEPGADHIYFHQPGVGEVSGVVSLESELPVPKGGLRMQGPTNGMVTWRRAGPAPMAALRMVDGSTDAFQFYNFRFENFSHPDGAMYAHYHTLILSNCVFAGNASTGLGGLHHWEGTGTTVSHCRFEGNTGRALSVPGGQRVLVEDSLFSNNTAPGNGAALLVSASYYFDTVTEIRRCRFTVNRSDSSGGAAEFARAANGRGHTFEVRDCTFDGNQAAALGGAIINGSPYLSLVNSTISGNTSGSHAGGIFCGDNFSEGVASFLHCTMTGNRCGPGSLGGGLFVGHATPRAYLRNTLVAGNTDHSAARAPSDVFGSSAGSLVSQGWNLVGVTNGSPDFTHAADRVGTVASPLDPRLGPLEDLGGAGPGHRPLAGSPALDAASLAGLELPTDLAGGPRTIDLLATANAESSDGTDIGALA